MKTLVNYIQEKLVINKDYKSPYTCAPTSFDELIKIIEDRYNKLGPGTKNDPIDFNDVDVSNIDSFYNDNTDKGIFDSTKFKYIDISYWNVSNVITTKSMFYRCEQLKSIGNLSKWDVSNVKDMNIMFCGCKQLKSIGYLSNWNVSDVENMNHMFSECEQLTSVGNISNWTVSNVKDMNHMFSECEQLKSVGDLSNWNVSNVEDMRFMFYNSGITNIPKWYKK